MDKILDEFMKCKTLQDFKFWEYCWGDKTSLIVLLALDFPDVLAQLNRYFYLNLE